MCLLCVLVSSARRQLHTSGSSAVSASLGPDAGRTRRRDEAGLADTVALLFPKVLVSVIRPATVVVRRKPRRQPEEKQVGKQTLIKSTWAT